MAKSKLPTFDLLDKLVEFFDTHDLGDYWEDMPESQFEIDIQRRAHLVALDDELAKRVTAIAKQKHISSNELIDGWLREKVSEYSKPV